MYLNAVIAVAVILLFIAIISGVTIAIINRNDRIRKVKWDAIEENIKKINDQIDNINDSFGGHGRS